MTPPLQSWARDDAVIEHAKAAARALLAGGFWDRWYNATWRSREWPGFDDPETWVDAVAPQPWTFDGIASLIGEPPNDADRQLWLGTWRCVLREGRES